MESRVGVGGCYDELGQLVVLALYLLQIWETLQGTWQLLELVGVGDQVFQLVQFVDAFGQGRDLVIRDVYAFQVLVVHLLIQTCQVHFSQDKLTALSKLVQQFRPILAITNFLKTASHGLFHDLLLLRIHFILQILFDYVGASGTDILSHCFQWISFELDTNQYIQKANLAWKIREIVVGEIQGFQFFELYDIFGDIFDLIVRKYKNRQIGASIKIRKFRQPIERQRNSIQFLRIGKLIKLLKSIFFKLEHNKIFYVHERRWLYLLDLILREVERFQTAAFLKVIAGYLADLVILELGFFYVLAQIGDSFQLIVIQEYQLQCPYFVKIGTILQTILRQVNLDERPSLPNLLRNNPHFIPTQIHRLQQLQPKNIAWHFLHQIIPHPQHLQICHIDNPFWDEGDLVVRDVDL